jgi:hypothetical protein
MEESLLSVRHTGARRPYAAFLCDRWNRNAPEDLRLVQIALSAVALDDAARGDEARMLGWFQCANDRDNTG